MKINPDVFLRNSDGEFSMPRDASRLGKVTDYYEGHRAADVAGGAREQTRTAFIEQKQHEGKPGITVGAIVLGRVQKGSPAWVEFFFTDDADIVRLDVINPGDENHPPLAQMYAGSIALNFGESIVLGRNLYPNLHPSTSREHVRLGYTAREGSLLIKGLQVTDLSRHGTQMLDWPKKDTAE